MDRSGDTRGVGARFLAFLMTLTLGLIARPTVAQTTIAQQIAVPAYFTRESGLWTELDSSAPVVTIAVANVINGPNYGYTVTWQVPVSDLTNTATTLLVLF